MGGEFAQWREWNYDESLDWHLLQWSAHGGVQKLVADLNRLVKNEPALHEVDFGYEGFEWVDCHNWELSTLCYMRKARNPDDFLITCCNFTPVPRHNYRIGVPHGGWYYEALNTDSMFYGGSNMGNYPGVSAIEDAAAIGDHRAQAAAIKRFQVPRFRFQVPAPVGAVQ
jgi:1,4-alpha-glucan branching enzyme